MSAANSTSVSRGAAAVVGNKVWRVLLGSVGFLVLIAIWQYASSLLVPSRLPSPAVVLDTIRSNMFDSVPMEAVGGGRGGMAPHLLVTLVRTLCAVALGTVLGAGLGLLFAASKSTRWLLQPPMEVLRLVPSLIAVPFLVLWFGVGAAPQLMLIVGYTALVMQLAVYLAVRDFPPHFLAYAQTLGASRRAVIRTAVLPGTMPELLGTLRVTLQLAWGLTVVAELLGSERGIGTMMLTMSKVFRTDFVIAGVILLAAMAWLIDVLFRALMTRTMPWHTSS